MDKDIRQIVRDRAVDRCEYCHLPQFAASFFSFHIEHIVARQHGGGDEHFLLKGATILGQTSIGRASVRLLAMNEESRLDMRQELLDHGEL